MNRATSATGWVRNPDGTLGWTWNPVTGCLNHINGMCKGGGFPCYAYRLAHGRLKARYLANTNLAPDAKGGVSTLSIGNQSATEREGDYADPFYPRFWEERLKGIKRGYHYTDWYGACEFGAAPRGIFVCDMGELFGDWIPKEWTHRVAEVMMDCPQDRFYLLTKQPQNLIKFSPFPENCWVGMTLTDRHFANNARQFLLGVDAKVKFLSLEPLLGHMDGWALGNAIHLADWLIIGACTGTGLEMMRLVETYKREDGYVLPYGSKFTLQPRIEWVREIIRAADKAGIPVFLKDNLLPLMRATQPMIEAKDIRQEMPNG